MMDKDLAQANIEGIAKLLPNVITETKDQNGQLKLAIDFELLKQELNNEIVLENKERFQLTWPGKKDAIISANQPIYKTLRPVVRDSVNWDTTENLYIEGDNLQVLKLLQESYLNKVKCIYIDPPYNTGKDYIYKDNFKQNKKNYLEKSDQLDKNGNRLFQNTDSNGRFHSDWLSMMYPRLKLARNLLREDGVIFISIDDNELSNLLKICDEIFGNVNFLNSFVVKRRVKSLNSQFANIKSLNQGFEYLIAYKKSNEFKYYKPYKEANENRQNGYWNSFWNNADRPTMRFEIDGININKGQWKWSKDRAMRALQNYKEFIKNHKEEELKDYYNKNKNHFYLNTGTELEFIKPSGNTVKYWVAPSKVTIMDTNLMDYYVNDDTAKRNFYFETAKKVDFIKKIIEMVCQENTIVLDFFSGSATTAHAVMQLNAEDGGNRKYIMVQLPERSDESSDAYKAGYKDICEIGKERIRRAAKKIKEEKGTDIDYGFRVFRLDTTNMKDVYYNPNQLKQGELMFLESNIKDNRTGEDLLIQVMLELGLELSLPMETREIHGKKIYFVAGNSLVACFDENLPEDLMRILANEKPLKVVFRDSSFKNDASRVNVDEIFKMISPSTDVKVI